MDESIQTALDLNARRSNSEDEIMKLSQIVYKHILEEKCPGLESPTLHQLQELLTQPMATILGDEPDLNGDAATVLGGRFRLRLEMVPAPTPQLLHSMKNVEVPPSQRQAVVDLNLFDNCMTTGDGGTNVILGETLSIFVIFRANFLS